MTIFEQVLREISMDFDYIWLCTRENKLKFLEVVKMLLSPKKTTKWPGDDGAPSPGAPKIRPAPLRT